MDTLPKTNIVGELPTVFNSKHIEKMKSYLYLLKY